MSDRTPCAVPGCRRTAPRTDADEAIVCGKHARLAPRATRRRLSYIQRRWKAFEAKWPDPSALTEDGLAEARRLLRANATGWKVFVAQVVRAAAGI